MPRTANPESHDYDLIVGAGPNSINVPLRVLRKNTGDAFLQGLGLKETRRGSRNYQKTVGGEELYRVLEDGEYDEATRRTTYTPEAEALRTALFKNKDYSGGCGELYAIYVLNGSYNAPFVGWDFD